MHNHLSLLIALVVICHFQLDGTYIFADGKDFLTAVNVRSSESYRLMKIRITRSLSRADR